MNRWLLPLAALLLAGPVQAQDKDAEALYRGFEKKVTEAKAFRLVFTIQATVGENVDVKGSLSYAAGNKLRLQLNGKERDRTLAVTVVSDGKRLAGKYVSEGKPETKDEATPDQLGEYLLGYFLRGGLFLSVEKATRPMPQFHPGKVKASNFKLLAKEKVGDRPAQVVQFTLEVADEKFAPVCKVWFDEQTRLPLKLVLELFADANKVELRIAETYSQWEFDPAMKADEFALPK
jgi:hypothetical protein